MPSLACCAHMACARPALSCVAGFSVATEKLPYLANSIATENPTLRKTLSRHKNTLLRQEIQGLAQLYRNTRPLGLGHTLSRHKYSVTTGNILPLGKTLSQHRKALSQHRNPKHNQTCRNRKKPCRDIFYGLKLETMSRHKENPIAT